MTTEQKISILIRKYGSKSIVRDNDSPLSGTEDSFSANKVLPQQVWIDLKSIPGKSNPLANSSIDLSTWPSDSTNPIVIKLIKKPLTWIPGTNAFYDPSDPSNASTVVDVISPDVHRSYSPYVYVLNTESNRYIHNISPSEYNWVFDHETGCLVFVNGLPSFMKSPQFQPPAITCYRYLGRKTASGISSGMVQGDTGPTGPTGPTGVFNQDSMVWRGEYDPMMVYSINDAVYDAGVVWVKTTGPTGPSNITSAYFDSITYNELINGFIPTLNEQYVDVEYTTNATPYFESLNDLSNILSSDFTSIGIELKNNDQNINMFDVTGPQNFYSKTFFPYSNRLYFFSPKKMTSSVDAYLEGAGYRLLSIEGLRSGQSTITTQSFLNISRSRLSSGTLQFTPNSSAVPPGSSDVSSLLTDSFFKDQDVILNGTSHIRSSDFQSCAIEIGDPGAKSPVQRDVYTGILHYFEDTRFVDTTFQFAYTGEYKNLTLVFNRCRITESRLGIADAGFMFPNMPIQFLPTSPNPISINIVFIDTLITCEESEFNFLDGSTITVLGTCTFPSRISPSSNVRGFSAGRTITDVVLNQFLVQQNMYSNVNPRTTTNFYFNQ